MMPTATARPLSSLWTSVRSQIRDSRESHAAKAALQRDLASYNSASDLDDLHAILDRYHDRETAAIREILAHQRAAADRRY
jgi:hypothetical protein